MKYIKTFENKTPKFKEGDIVYVFDDKTTQQLKKDTPYEISNVDATTANVYYDVLELPEHRYHESRFMSENEYKYIEQPNTGTIVKCIDGFNIGLVKNKCYTISGTFGTSLIYYRLEEFPEPGYNFWKGRFILATPEEIKQYKLEKSTEKYNL